MTSFRIGDRQIGGDAPVFIVAELSANHGGRLETAAETIRAAARAGADAIKLQTYTPDTLTLKSDALPFVVKTKNEWAGRTLHDLYAEAMTPWAWHAPLQAVAREEGLLFFSTPFDVTATELLEELAVPAHKVASFEITDLPLVEHVARRGKPMIISTGMASLAEVKAAVRVCRDAGNDQIALLRCVSAYPAKPESMNLASFSELRRFGTVVGLSDHTRDVTVAVASVALGAKVIEKHFIVDRSVGGPDAFFSLDPVEFRAMVDSVRTTEKAMGAPYFGPGEEERTSITFRRSLFFARPVREGQVVTCDDLRSVRPADGLAPHHLPEVLGRVATRDVAAGTPARWEDVRERPVPSVHLRAAGVGDAAWLRALRNDPETRDASATSLEVTESEHEAWLRTTLASSHRRLFIALDAEDRPIGQGRLDVEAGESAEVSLALTAGARGKWLAAELLRALEVEGKRAGLRLLRARIRATNERSLRAFRAAGYYGFLQRPAEPGGDQLFVWCERRIAPFAGT